MTKSRVVLVAGIVLIAGAYVLGMWPERQRFTEAQTQLEAARLQLSGAEARVRLGEILGQLLTLSDAVGSLNYGDAATQASAYFDRVTAEARLADSPDTRQVLERIQQTRDLVTAALARAEPAILDTLREQQVALRRALGYSAP